ncbi:MAG: hypothetical protein Ct9H300mP28_35820 [Pseudomonadota bacterium]|nr:MAG: hypothetical protein Ct9H300mP28_35820 [Pseudomonadota bacterium]
MIFLAVLDGTVTAFVLALIALGLSLVFGVMRIVNVSHGEFFMLGAVLSWFAYHWTADSVWGFVLALLIAPQLWEQLQLYLSAISCEKLTITLRVQ